MKQSPGLSESTSVTKPIKLTHVIPTLDQSGSEKQLSLLLANLPREKFDSNVLVLTRGGYYERTLAQAGIPVRVLNKRLKLDPSCFRTLKRELQQHKPDIVQTWLFAGNCYGRLAAKLAKVPHIIATERCVDEWKSEYQFVIDRWLARWTDQVIVNSMAVADFYRGRGIEPAKIHVIPNGIEEVPAPAAPTLARELEELGVTSETRLIGFVGRLWPQKRVEDLLWATDILRISGAPIQVVILGEGPKRHALENFAQRLRLNSIVHFLGHRSDVSSWLARMNVLVLPSEFEGMPNVALEAMQAGVPVVATRIAGMDEVVVDGMTGLLVEPKEPFFLAKAISKVLDDPEFAARLGAAGQRFVRDRFSVDAMVAQYTSIYEKIVGRT